MTKKNELSREKRKVEPIIDIIGVGAIGGFYGAMLSAVVTNIGGRAWLTGISHYGTNPEDPFPHGYRLNHT